jgi:hypothetical protein
VLYNVYYRNTLYKGELLMKKVLLGFIVGIMFSGVCYAAGQFTATQVDYKVYINGKQYADANKPVLNVGGNAYLPLRNTADALNVPISWNEAKRRVEIGKAPADTPEPTPKTTNDNVSITLSNIKDKHVPAGSDTDTSATIAITNNGSKAISFNLKDIKVNYKYKESVRDLFKKSCPDLIVKNQGLGICETSKAFPDIQPGETRKLNIEFMIFGNPERYLEWVSITWKGQQEFGKVTIK